MLLLYVLALVTSAGVVGLFVRQILSLLGFVPGLLAGTYVVVAAGSLYAAFELFLMTALRLYRPSRDRTTQITETISFSACLLLLPYILHFPMPWPNARLENAEPIIFLLAFAGMHVFFKLATFYASLESAPSSRYSALGWGVAAACCIVFTFFGTANWARETERARGVAAGELASYRIGEEFAQARSVTEGAILRGDVRNEEGDVLALRLANLSDGEDVLAYATAYLTIDLIGDQSRSYSTSVTLRDAAWAELRVPSHYFPTGLREYQVRWTRKSPPNWQDLLGMRPIVYNLPDRPGATPPPPARLLISGPSVYRERVVAKPRNFLLIIVEGLGSNHVSMLGYDREVTPSIDRLAFGALVFPNAYARSDGPEAALGALLAGTAVAGTRGLSSPGRSLAGVLQEKGYATAAFSEAPRDDAAAIWHDFFGAGFDIVNVHSRREETSPGDPEGSSTVLDRARNWIDDHSGVAYFCLLHLRELRDPKPSERYEAVYPEDGGEVNDRDLFDNALLHLDRQIGALLKSIRDHDAENATCIVLTSLYGHDFSLGAAKVRLEAPSYRVPILIQVPGARNARRPDRATLADVAFTIATLADTRLDPSSEGRYLLEQ